MKLWNSIKWLNQYLLILLLSLWFIWLFLLFSVGWQDSSEEVNMSRLSQVVEEQRELRERKQSLLIEIQIIDEGLIWLNAEVNNEMYTWLDYLVGF
jgi:hypothetical protein